MSYCIGVLIISRCMSSNLVGDGKVPGDGAFSSTYHVQVHKTAQRVEEGGISWYCCPEAAVTSDSLT